MCTGHCRPPQTSAIHTEPNSGPLEVNEKTLRVVSGFGAETSVCKSSSISSVAQRHRELQEHPGTPRLSGSRIGAGSIFPWRLLKHLRCWQPGLFFVVWLVFLKRGKKIINLHLRSQLA